MALSDYVRQLRKKVGHDLLLLPTVAIVTFDDRGRVLLGKHSETGKWVLPGGCVDPHESPADTAVREMWKETGLLVEPICIIGVYGGPEFRISYANGDKVSCVVTVFECRTVGGAMCPDALELSELAYYSQADIASLELAAWMPPILYNAFEMDGRTRFPKPTWNPPANDEPKSEMSEFLKQLRKKLGNDLLIMPAAGAIIFDEQDRILLQQRSDNGQWHPPAGAIEPDESPADTVVREVWEETGLIVEPTKVTGVYSGTDLYFTYPHGDQVAIYSIMFNCQVIGGRMRPDGIEVVDLRYFAPKEVAGNFFPKRWQWRMVDAFARQPKTCFVPPVWLPT